MHRTDPQGKTDNRKAQRMHPSPLRHAAARSGGASLSLSSAGPLGMELLQLQTLRMADPEPDEPPHPPLPDLLPPHLRWWSFDRLDPFRAPLAYHVCREYATHGEYQGQKCLFLTGPVGIGKSCLAAAILHQTIAQAQHAHYARFWPLQRGLRLIRQSLSLPPDQHLDLAALFAHPLLIVDDVGWPASDWEAHQFYLLFETLWAAERPAVFVTDLGPEALEEALVYAQVWAFLDMCHLVEAWEPGTPPRW